MRGKPIETVQKCVQRLLQELRGESATALAWMSVITYADEVAQIFPLTEVQDVMLPVLEVGGQADIDKALQKVAECAAQGQRRNYPPILWIFSNGVCFGGIENGLNALQMVEWGYIGVVCAGENPKISLLQQITKNTNPIENFDDCLKHFADYRWWWHPHVRDDWHADWGIYDPFSDTVTYDND